MADNINPSNLQSSNLSNDLFPILFSMLQEVSEKGEYRSCPVLLKKHAVHSTRGYTRAAEAVCATYANALNVAGKTLHPFLSDFVSNFNSRFEERKNINSILVTAGNLFDVTKILNFEKSSNIESDLFKYARLAKDSGNLDSKINESDLVKEYELFATRVKDIAPRYRYIPKKTSIEKPKVLVEYPERYMHLDIYKKMLDTETLYKDIGNVLYLALTALRSGC